MSSFEEWFDWALKKSSAAGADSAERTWGVVAKNARTEACYRKSSTLKEFQAELGRKSPRKGEDFEAVCAQFLLTGRKVGREPPLYLCRVLSEEALRTILSQEVLVDSGVRDLVAQDRQNSAAALTSVSEDAFTRLDQLAEAPGSEFQVGPPWKVSVFASFDERDSLPPKEEAKPAFWEKIRKERQFGMRVADMALYRLALQPPRHESTYVLLYYHRKGLHKFLIPVPPDAGFFSLFVPQLAGGSPPFGKTCPGGPPDCDDEGSEPELVHSNQAISYTQAWVVSLGRAKAPRP